MDLAHWGKAGRAFIRQIRSRRLIQDVANAGLRADVRRDFACMSLVDAYPKLLGLEIDLGRVQVTGSSLDPYEWFAIAAIARLRDPRRIFEIGTFDGASALLLARNAPNAEVFTLDLPPEAAGAATVRGEVSNAKAGVGRRYEGEPEASRITQLLGDSRTFDFTPWRRSIDLVFVDGGHEHDTAKADTATAMELLAPEGIVVWDDYALGWPGVISAVQQAGIPVLLPVGTELAVYDASQDGHWSRTT